MRNIIKDLNEIFQACGSVLPIVINYGTYNASGSQITNNFYGNEQEPTLNDEPLANYIYDKHLLKRVIAAAHSCTNTAEVNDKVIGLLRQSRQIEESVLRKTDFLNALIPHLTAFPEPPSVEALSKAIRRNS